MLEEQYSGKNSEAFWEVVHLVDDEDSTLYALGVKLQDLEGEVLKKLNERAALIEKLKWSHDHP